MTAAHGLQSPVAAYAQSSRCCACLKQFKSKERLAAHLASCTSYLTVLIVPVLRKQRMVSASNEEDVDSQ